SDDERLYSRRRYGQRIKVAVPHAGESGGEVIHHGGRKNMGVRQAEKLGFFRVGNQAVRILSRPDIVSVVDGIGGVERVFIRDNAVDLHDSEVFVHRIRSGVIGIGHTGTDIGPVRLRPQGEVWKDRGIKVRNRLIDSVGVRQQALPRPQVWDNGNFRQVPHLTKTFIVSKNEGLVLLDGATGRSTKLISPERGDARVRRPNLTVKEVPGIEGAVAQKLVPRAVEGIGAGLRHDADLSPGTVAELRRVHVRNDV